MSKTVLITGASRGIGAETAKQFARAGYRVAINYYTHREAAETLQKELENAGADCAAFCADVSDRIQVDAMVRQITARFGQIDVLVNNAGIARQKLFTDITADEWRQMFAVNMDGMFHTTQAVLSQMIRRKSGKIINLSSIWGISGASCEVHYSASKAAVIGFTKALAKELGPSGVAVNCVAPGVVSTEMNANLDPAAMDALCEETPLGRIGSPSEIAGLILFLASEQGDFITGQVISPNGGIVI